MAEQLFKKESSIEEKKYQEAVGLQESVSYIIRFERRVIVLNSAANKFEKLGEYKDASERMDLCRKAAKEAEIEGCRETFELALVKEKEAKCKSDYIEAIEEFKRVWKKEAYDREARKHIADCKEKIIRLEKRATLKRRVTVLVVLAICIFAFTKTIAYPFTKGLIHQQMGHYQAALNNYKISQGMPGASKKLRACYYHLGLESLEKGNKKKALRQFVKAATYEDASAKAAVLEQEFLAEAQKGQKIAFGSRKWIVLDKTKDKILLLCNKIDKKVIYSDKGNTSWEKSKVYNWLNSTFLSQTFSMEETAIITNPYIATVSGNESTAGYAFSLSSEEYEKYVNLIIPKQKNWWLRDKGLTAMGAEYVNQNGEVKKTYVNNYTCYIRPAIWVKIP